MPEKNVLPREEKGIFVGEMVEQIVSELRRIVWIVLVREKAGIRRTAESPALNVLLER